MNAIIEFFSLSWVKQWLLDTFARKSKSEPQTVQMPEIEVVQPVIAAPRKKREKSNRKNMADLLESLSETFKHLDFDIDGVSFERMLKSEVIGLKKCSPLVVEKSFFYDVGKEKTTVNPKLGLPTYFVVAVNRGSDNDKKDTLEPDFAFGMRVRKPPWNVTRLTGQVYLFGMAWRVNGKHMWLGFWLSVRDDGTIQVAHELHNVNVPVSGSSYTKRTWEPSSWHGPSQDRVLAITSCFCDTLSTYQTRKDKWNVGVSNGKRRLVFLIEQPDAKHYFKNRRKTVTVNGKTKPIIHFVRAHTQQHGDKIVEIPEHIRGLREFDWNEYHCTITAPKFHTFLSSDFELAADFVDEDVVSSDKSRWLEIGDLADKMNDLEDNNKRRRR